MLTTSNRVELLLVSSLAYSLLHWGGNAFSAHFFPSYNKLSASEKVDWNSRLASNTNALIGLLCLFPTIFSSEYSTYGCCHMTESTDFWSSVVAGYFLYDVMLILQYWEKLGSTAMLAHHCAACISSLLFPYMRCGSYFYALMSVTEISTPFINQRWFLAVTNNKSSRLYTINGVLIWLGFAFGRIGVSLYVFDNVLHTWWDELITLPWWKNTTMAVPYAVLTLLNAYWFIIITQGLLKLLRSPPPKTA